MYNAVLHGTLQVMAFNHDHLEGKLWNKVSSSLRSKAGTYQTSDTIKGLVLPDVVEYAKIFFGCDTSIVYIEREISGDQFYWEKRNMFFDVKIEN